MNLLLIVFVFSCILTLGCDKPDTTGNKSSNMTTSKTKKRSHNISSIKKVTFKAGTKLAQVKEQLRTS